MLQVVRKIRRIRTSETYLAMFNNMDTVVFFNGSGREVQLWKELTGATLAARNIEGTAPALWPNVTRKEAHTLNRRILHGTAQSTSHTACWCMTM